MIWDMMWDNTTGMSDFSSLGMLMGIYNGGFWNGDTMVVPWKVVPTVKWGRGLVFDGV